MPGAGARSIVQTMVVILIALLALARRVIIGDFYQVPP